MSGYAGFGSYFTPSENKGFLHVHVYVNVLQFDNSVIEFQLTSSMLCQA